MPPWGLVVWLAALVDVTLGALPYVILNDQIINNLGIQGLTVSLDGSAFTMVNNSYFDVPNAALGTFGAGDYIVSFTWCGAGVTPNEGGTGSFFQRSTDQNSFTGPMSFMIGTSKILLRQIYSVTDSGCSYTLSLLSSAVCRPMQFERRNDVLSIWIDGVRICNDTNHRVGQTNDLLYLNANLRFGANYYDAATQNIFGTIKDVSLRHGAACAMAPNGIMKTQFYSPEMSGCGGAVTNANRATLCGPGYSVCSAAQYAKYYGGRAPMLNYWVNDTLNTDSTAFSCQVKELGGTLCANTPSLVCATNGSTNDLFGNIGCPLRNCGYLNDKNAYFGACRTDSAATAGTLCCACNDSPIPDISTTGSCTVFDNCVSSPNFPNAYGNGQTCNIKVNSVATLNVVNFLVVSGDYLTVNGVQYSGYIGPFDVSVGLDSTISWSSNSAFTSTGWRICLAPPNPIQLFRVSTGTGCTAVGSCIYSRNYDTGGTYSNLDNCSFYTTSAGYVTAVSFATEQGYDNLNISGSGYSGTNAPQNVFLAAYTTATWKADVSNVAAGWKVCITNTMIAPTWVVTGPCEVRGNCISSPNWPYMYEPAQSCTLQAQRTGSLNLVSASLAAGDFITMNSVAYGSASISSLQGRVLTALSSLSWASDAGSTGKGWKICLVPMRWSPITATSVGYGSIPHTNNLAASISLPGSHYGTCSTTCSGNQWSSSSCTLAPFGCASMPQQVYGASPEMVGCGGSVTFANRSRLCGYGYVPCTAATYALQFNGVPPNFNYWTDDPLLYGGSGSSSCTASVATGGSCGTTPMRVCAGSSDGFGNVCNWINCGLDTTANQYFGGCSGNLLAGTLCCKVHCPFFTIPSGNITYSDIPNSNPFDSTATIGCPVNTTWSLDQPVLSCANDSTWGVIGTCGCPTIDYPNGGVSFSDPARRTVGSQVNFTCQANFQIQNGPTTATCALTGLWGAYGKCGCPNFTTVSNGVLSYSSSSANLQGSSVNLTCAPYYSGNVTIFCLPNTGWSDVPMCTDINECAIPAVCGSNNNLCRNMVGAQQQCLPYFVNSSLASGTTGAPEVFVSLAGAPLKIRFGVGNFVANASTQALGLIRTLAVPTWQQYSDKISACVGNGTSKFAWVTDLSNASVFPSCPPLISGSTDLVWALTGVSITGANPVVNITFQVPPGIGRGYSVIYRQITNVWTQRLVTVVNASYLSQTTQDLASCQTKCLNTTSCVAVEWFGNSCRLLGVSPEFSEVPLDPSPTWVHYARGWTIQAISSDQVSYNPPTIDFQSLRTAVVTAGKPIIPYTDGDTQITFTGANFAPNDPDFGVWLTNLAPNSFDPVPSSFACPLDPQSNSTYIVCTFQENLFGVFSPLVKALDTFIWGDAYFSIFQGALINYTTPNISFATEGGQDLTIVGMKFSDSSTVTIDGKKCVKPNFINDTNGNGRLICTTPPGTGINKAVIVLEAGILSTPKRVFNYGGPVVSQVTSQDCDQDLATQNLIKCKRHGGSLTIMGANLAAELSNPPAILVGRFSCNNSQGVGMTSIISCNFPEGFTTDNQITVTQYNGLSTVVLWSLNYAQCPGGTKEISTSGNVRDCVDCGPGEYQDLIAQTTCNLCPMGTYADSNHSTVCLNCLPGSYQNRAGQTTCRTCDVGTFSSATKATLCVGCTAGRFTGNMNSSSCDQCTAGKYTSEDGGSTCIDCDLGFYGPQAQLSSCLPCSAGSFSNTNGSTVCQQCDPGSFQNATNQTNCNVCGPGTLSTQKGQPTCADCPAGSFNNVTNSTSCASCTPGMYQPAAGASVCVFCDPGKYTASGSSFVDCSLCDPGGYCDAIGCSNCTKCPKGSFQGGPNATVCDTCGPGKFSPTLGLSECAECKSGSFNDLMNQTSCQLCSPGSFQLSGAQTKCDLCPPGTFTAVSGLTNCSDCAPGSFTNSFGFSNCSLCPTGTSQNSSGRASCDDCPVGQVAHVSGYRFCVACGGSSVALDKAQSCVTCPTNAYANSDATSCVCKKGFYSVSFALADARVDVESLQIAVRENNDSQTGAWQLGFFCLPCPDGAACTGDGISLSAVEPVPGWCADKDNLNLSFFPCPNPNSCLATGCAPGYQGSLCKACGDDYGTVSGGVCARCQDRSWERGKLFLIGLAIVILLALFVYQTRRAALRDSQSFMVAAKILVSGMQFNSIALTMNFKFWATATELLSTQGAVSQLGLQYIFTSECALKSPDYNPVVVSSVLYLFSPLLIYLGVLPFAAAAALYARRERKLYLESLSELPEEKPGDQDYKLKSLFKNYAITGTVIIAFLIHPMLARKAFEMFHCVQIGVNPNETFLYVDLRIQCYTFPHILWVFLLGLPLLLLMVGEPLVFASFLHKHKAQLNQEDYKLNYSFLYKGYQPALWSVWECSIMARKSIIVAIAVFGNRSTRIQALLGVALCFVVLGFHQTYKPFMDPWLNRLELLSILTSASLYFFAQFLLHTTDDVGASGETLSQVLIVMFQITFIVSALAFIFYGVFSKVKTGIARRNESKRESKAMGIQMADYPAVMTGDPGDLPKSVGNPETLPTTPSNTSPPSPPPPSNASLPPPSNASSSEPPLYRAYTAVVTAQPPSEMYSVYSSEPAQAASPPLASAYSSATLPSMYTPVPPSSD